MNDSGKYYIVECKGGHTGSKKTYCILKFVIMANSGKEAAYKGRWMPRCKHHHKDCVISVRKSNKDECLNIWKENSKNPYYHCKCRQDQSLYNLEDEFIMEPRYLEDNEPEERESKHVTDGKTFIKYPKKYIRFNRQLTKEDMDY